jgi:hypothetical protein
MIVNGYLIIVLFGMGGVYLSAALMMKFVKILSVIKQRVVIAMPKLLDVVQIFMEEFQATF